MIKKLRSNTQRSGFFSSRIFLNIALLTFSFSASQSALADIEDYSSSDFGVDEERLLLREQQNREAMQLLNRMRIALHEKSYRGTLVYRHNESLSTLQIDHHYVNGVAHERVLSLNEQGSEISRELKGFSLASIPVIRPEMGKVYSFDIGREKRVANVPCRIITVRPKDRARYLQKYCIDPVSGLLLDYMLVGKTHTPVEQFMFTSIEIEPSESEATETQFLERPSALSDATTSSVKSDANPPLAAMVNSLSGSASIDNTESQNRTSGQVVPIVPMSVAEDTVISPEAVENTEKTITPSKLSKQQENQFNSGSVYPLQDGWVMQSLPAGFKIRRIQEVKPMGFETQYGGKTDNMPSDVKLVTRHYLVSDGMSSLSVFIAPVTMEVPNYGIQANSGALNVISLRKHGQWVTAVGEVPESTLKQVIHNLRYVGPGEEQGNPFKPFR